MADGAATLPAHLVSGCSGRLLKLRKMTTRVRLDEKPPICEFAGRTIGRLHHAVEVRLVEALQHRLEYHGLAVQFLPELVQCPGTPFRHCPIIELLDRLGGAPRSCVVHNFKYR